jgi:hypothetical protein
MTQNSVRILIAKIPKDRRPVVCSLIGHSNIVSGCLMHVIERRSDGYAPPMSTIRRVLRIAGRKGFRTDWDCVGVLETGALCFGSISDDTRPANLVAIKLSGEYRFMTEREYLALRLLKGMKR